MYDPTFTLKLKASCSIGNPINYWPERNLFPMNLWKAFPKHSINMHSVYRSGIILGNSKKQVSDIGLKQNNIFILVGMSRMWEQMKEYLYLHGYNPFGLL